MKRIKGMGWMRDLPDYRDFVAESPPVQEIREQSQKIKKTAKAVPVSMDLRPWCSPIEDQEDLGSCTANAGVGLLEYFQRRAFGKHLDGSRLFLYKVSRNLLNWVGDQGAYLRCPTRVLLAL